MHGMCYECVTSADCTPPRTCDRPPDGDGICSFDLGLLIISKESGEKGTTQTTHLPRYDREFASSSTLALMILGCRIVSDKWLYLLQ